jgi:hypothetical protein
MSRNYITNLIFPSGNNIHKGDQEIVSETDGIFTKPVSFDELLDQVGKLRIKKGQDVKVFSGTMQ